MKNGGLPQQRNLGVLKNIPDGEMLNDKIGLRKSRAGFSPFYFPFVMGKSEKCNIDFVKSFRCLAHYFGSLIFITL